MKNKLESTYQLLRKKGFTDLTLREWHSSLVLEGTVSSWDHVVRAGKLAARAGYKGVVNRLEVPGLSMPAIHSPQLADNFLDHKRVDVMVIGGGIIGSAIARELAKWNISILLVDKEEDLAMHTSSRNDGMVHPGFEPKPGSQKARFNVRGNELYSQVTKDLAVPFQRVGSNVLYDKRMLRLLAPFLNNRAKQNGVSGMRYLSKAQLKLLEPAATDEIVGAIHFASTGILSPYKMTIALAENAVMNGAEVALNTIVLGMEKVDGRIFSVTTNRGIVFPQVVVNAAGVYADKLADMAGDQFFTIHPRKGELAFLDRKKGHLLNSVLGKPSLELTKSNTKGGGLVKTIDGNILVGPDAYEQPYREDYTTNKANLEQILKKHLPLVPQLVPGDVIAYCAGIRAATYEEDFIVEQSEYVENLVHAAGIQSPGLASAPAIAEEIEQLVCRVLRKVREVKPNPSWNPRRRGIPDLKNMPLVERSALIRQNPDYGQIICRCEEISKGEIIDALNSPIPVRTVDGIKRRVRAGMGRCQGGFCQPLVLEILHQEQGLDFLNITKKGNSSFILAQETKAASGGEENGTI